MRQVNWALVYCNMTQKILLRKMYKRFFQIFFFKNLIYHFNSSNIHPFQFCESKIKALFVETNAPKDIKDWQIHLFKNITGVDPENTKIKGIVVFNVKELMHVFRRIWQDFGPFPLIGIRNMS